MPSLREQAELTALRVCAGYRQTRSLPSPFSRWLRVERGVCVDRVTPELVERFAREWSERMLAVVDAGGDPEEAV